jgi:hypothetical protein
VISGRSASRLARIMVIGFESVIRECYDGGLFRVPLAGWSSCVSQAPNRIIEFYGDANVSTLVALPWISAVILF